VINRDHSLLEGDAVMATKDSTTTTAFQREIIAYFANGGTVTKCPPAAARYYYPRSRDAEAIATARREYLLHLIKEYRKDQPANIRSVALAHKVMC
jgi:hypothetical protein